MSFHGDLSENLESWELTTGEITKFGVIYFQSPEGFAWSGNILEEMQNNQNERNRDIKYKIINTMGIKSNLSALLSSSFELDSYFCHWCH